MSNVASLRELNPARCQLPVSWYFDPAIFALEKKVLFDAGLDRASWPGTLHAAEHAGIGMLPLFTICDRWDVAGVSTNWQPQTGTATIVIYDGYPGGAGIAELGFGSGRLLLERTLEAVEACPCTSGCPSCVQSPKCGNLNEPLDKAGAIALLREMTAAATRLRAQPVA